MAIALVALLVAALIGILHALQVSDPTRKDLLIAATSSGAAFVLFSLQGLIVPEPVRATRPRLEYPDQFTRNFATLLDNVVGDRLVIAIDNLDRCSPARVTEMLSAIKTFLEPAFDEPSNGPPSTERKHSKRSGRHAVQRRLTRICFIVAADDAALRRHLATQELSRSPAPLDTGTDRSDGEDAAAQVPAEVIASVEEYLRKFFGASLRVRKLLDDDVRKFVADQLDRLIKAQGLSQQVADSLIDMTSQGLKGNPRRIKQFVNNLHMRMQMLAERKSKGRIQIDADVRVVAKLAILDEEFPDAFRALERDPRLLARWQAQARAADGAATAEDGDSLSDDRLISFLRFTDDIQPPDIQAYLHLKQTKAEVDLPRHGEFVELLDGGGIEKLATLLDEEAGELIAFRDVARSHFREACKQKAWSRAHNTLRAIVEVPALHGEDGAIVTSVLSSALSEPALRTRLSQLEPNTLLAVVTRGDRGAILADRVIAQLVESGDSQPSDPRAGIWVALARHTAMINNDNRKLIAATLAKEDVCNDVVSYGPIAVALPEVIGPEVLDRALSKLEEIGGAAISMANPAFQVTVAALRATPDGDRLERLLRLTASVRGDGIDSGAEAVGAAFAEMAAIVDACEPAGSMKEAALGILDGWPSMPIESRRGVLSVCLAICRRSPDAAATVGVSVADRAFELGDGAETLEMLTADFAGLPTQIRDRVAEITADMLAGERDNSHSIDLDGLLELFPPVTQTHMIRKALESAITAERLETAGDLLTRLNEDEQQQVVSEAVSRAEHQPTTHLPDVRFIVRHQARLDEDSLFCFAMRLAAIVRDKREFAIDVAPLIAQLQPADAPRRHELVKHLIDTERQMSAPERREAVLRAARGAAGTRSSKARTLVDARLKEIGNSNNQLADAARNLLASAS